MQTIGTRVCPACGALVPESDPCPVCLLREALRPEASSNSSRTGLCPSGLDFEHYRILQKEDGIPIELGRGAMGVTYKALDINLQSVVALKVINAEFLGDESSCRRFVREARAAARVRHENVAGVFHLGRQAHAYFYAMEFVEGEPLHKVIRQTGRLEPAPALRVIALVAAGLEAIAKEQLVHRDIKPSNIVVRFEAGIIVSAKIIDLGLAKSAVEDKAISAISIPGTFAGTPAYASPEQFAGIGADIRSDLYSLGITLWEMLCGELPFRGSPLELWHQHQYAALPVQKLTQVPRPVVGLLETLLEKDPGRRFQTASELQQAVAKALQAQDLCIATGALGSMSVARCHVDRPAGDEPASSQCGHKARTILQLLGHVIGVIGLACVLHLPLSDHKAFFDQPDQNENSVAVLPFVDISPNKDSAYFADGVQEEILRNLAGIAQLKVVSRTSVMQYRSDREVDLRKVANSLGVTNVLEGTVRRDGIHIRVNTALVDARNDSMIWADSYDRDLTNVFLTESEIAREVAAELNSRLNGKRGD